ncbi:DUF924 family protein [uncultured Paraglaciecola sp.]|uniref:DUF924 family protein n=1 Tax=uncultured Paraglaciecola sp. TaxID=1765024 RepID=UPI00260CC1EA|nr:DUF924 family protein [uncultured Paraglaciecola sp.]
MTESNEVLKFWFEEIEPSQWWTKDLQFDQMIKQRFAHLHLAANRCELSHWRSTPEGRLAEIIVLDQFSRNMFRDTPASFASDPLALALAQEAIAQGADKVLNQSQRNFLYMPYMHSESMLIHDLAIVLYTENGSKNSLDFEIKHSDIIRKFARYPHRNAILGRTSTQAERLFLTQANSSF